MAPVMFYKTMKAFAVYSFRKWCFVILGIVLIGCRGSNNSITNYTNFPIQKELKAVVIELDSAIFRYPYRIRVHEDKAIVLDLHNLDYFYHLFQYPEFTYLSSFGKRGSAPEETLMAENIRFVHDNNEIRVWALDSNKNKITQLKNSLSGDSLLETKAMMLDKELLRSLDFCVYNDSLILIPDYSGESRICVIDTSGVLRQKVGAIPSSNHKALKESKPAMAQAWRSFIDYHPQSGVLAAVTQLGEVLQIYNTNDTTSRVIMGPNGEPEFQEMRGSAIPSGIMGFADIQITDNYIYTVFQGHSFKEMMKQRESIVDGGQYIYVFSLTGEPVCKYTLDRHIHGIYVDEKSNRVFATDVNHDQPIVYFDL